MATDEETLPDTGAEDADAALTEDDWRADVERYYQDDRPAPRARNEFTTGDWTAYLCEIRGIDIHRNTASHELEQLVRQGKVTKRQGLEGGKRCWLYRFVKGQ